MRNISLMLPDSYAELLNQFAEEQETTRSELIRRAIDQLLEQDKSLIGLISDKTPFPPGEQRALEHIKNENDFEVFTKAIERAIKALDTPEQRFVQANVAAKDFSTFATEQGWNFDDTPFTVIQSKAKEELMRDGRELN